jgi:hypothetical protein
VWNEADLVGTAAENLDLSAVGAALSDDAQSIRPPILDMIGELADLASELGDETLAAALEQTHSVESRAHPGELAKAALADRLPEFVRFTESARRLETEYDLQQVADQPPHALRNLADLAGLDLHELAEAIASGETGTTQTLVDRANERLGEELAAWTQKPSVHVAFDTNGTLILIHVRSGSGHWMQFAERSDGLRQFIALIALTAQQRRTIRPILLIDEVETHLHYDAQADLMRILDEQTAAAQVIYTTHSAACLPDDLGSGVRVIEGVGATTLSKIRNSFWTDDPGLGPVLLAMGAASLAFIPLRPSVIGEGPTEVILLPSLLKEALSVRSLGYQVAPGAAGVRPAHVAAFDLQAPSTAWVVDHDAGGLAIRKKLLTNGVAPERVIVLGGKRKPFTLEDLVTDTAYIEAARRYFRDVGAKLEPGKADVAKGDRYGSLIKWCQANGLAPPSKVAIANRILELRGELPLIDPSSRTLLRQLDTSIRRVLKMRRR